MKVLSSIPKDYVESKDNSLRYQDAENYFSDEVAGDKLDQAIVDGYERKSYLSKDVKRIADDAVSMWCRIDVFLSPIIGQRGVAALYKRSLYLAQTSYPWLSEVHDATHLPGEFNTLKVALVQQTSISAKAASDSILKIFYALLGSFVGSSLSKSLQFSISNGTSVNDI